MQNTQVLFISWWYTEANKRLFLFIKHLYLYIFDLFSVRICLLTFFAPWKRDQISMEGLSLSQTFQVWLLNLSSRFIGSAIKLFTLLTYVVVTIIFSALAFMAIVVWIIYPALIIYLVYLGFKILRGA